MQSTYWSDWKSRLARWGLRSTACVVLDHTAPLIPFAAQIMLIGWPVVRGFSLEKQYGALIATLEDDQQRQQFRAYLQEPGP